MTDRDNYPPKSKVPVPETAKKRRKLWGEKRPIKQEPNPDNSRNNP